MMSYTTHTLNPDRYVAYYKSQAGHGIPGYSGGAVMYGAGLGGIFRGLFRFAAPLLRKGLNIAKPHLKTAAKNIVTDVFSNTKGRKTAQGGSGLTVMTRNRHTAKKRPPGVRQELSTLKKRRVTRAVAPVDRKPQRRKQQRARTIAGEHTFIF